MEGKTPAAGEPNAGVLTQHTYAPRAVLVNRNTMPDDPSSPEPPETLSESVVESVADLDAEELTALADYTSALSDYADALATHRRGGRGSAEEASGGTATRSGRSTKARPIRRSEPG